MAATMAPLRQDPHHDPLTQLLQRPDLWRGHTWQQPERGYSTGFAALDAQLADFGWPKQGICELFYQGFGQGELTLLFPLLKQFAPRDHILSSPESDLYAHPRTEGLIPLIAPPHIPYGPAFRQQGIAAENLLVIDSQDRKEQLWAFEQALLSGACPVVLIWLESISVSEVRRLQLASEKGASLGIVFLPQQQQEASHPVVLKMALAIASDAHANEPTLLTRLSLLKRRGGWPKTHLNLPLMTAQLASNLKRAAKWQCDEPASSQHRSDADIVRGPWV